MTGHECLEHTITYQKAMIEGRDARFSRADNAAIDPNVCRKIHAMSMALKKTFSTHALCTCRISVMRQNLDPKAKAGVAQW